MDAEALKLAICEDTKQEEEKLLALLDRLEIPTEPTVFHSGEELLAVYRPQMFDLLLMDIYMDGISGIEAVTRIREMDEEVPVAFITTSKDHALESYRLSALQYIEKPYRQRDITNILHLAQRIRADAPVLTIHWQRQEKRIRLAQILYLETQDSKVIIYLKTGETEQVYEKLTDLLPQLEGQPFFHCHKSFCVNLAGVDYMDKELSCFMMQNNKNVPIRRGLLREARRVLEQFLFSRAEEASQ